jgi:hypothetical protein
MGRRRAACSVLIRVLLLLRPTSLDSVPAPAQVPVPAPTLPQPPLRLLLAGRKMGLVVRRRRRLVVPMMGAVPRRRRRAAPMGGVAVRHLPQVVAMAAGAWIPRKCGSRYWTPCGRSLK